MIQTHTLVPAEASFGYMTRIKFVVENPKDAKDAMLVLSLAPTRNTSEEGFDFAHPVYGEIERAGGEYRYNAMAQQASAMNVHEGLLLPGQSLILEVSFRVIYPSETFRFRIVRMSLEETVKACFAYVKNAAFRPLDLDAYRQIHGRIVARATGPVESSVLVTTLGAPEEQSVEVGFGTLKTPKISFEAASRQVGEFKQVLYCRTLGGWVFKGDGKDILVGSIYPRSEIAGCHPRVYRDIDMANSIPVRIDAPTAKELGYEAKPGDGMYRQGFYIEVPAHRFYEFALAAGRKGRRLDLHRYFFDEYTFTLV